MEIPKYPDIPRSKALELQHQAGQAVSTQLGYNPYYNCPFGDPMEARVLEARRLFLARYNQLAEAYRARKAIEQGVDP